MCNTPRRGHLKPSRCERPPWTAGTTPRSLAIWTARDGVTPRSGPWPAGRAVGGSLVLLGGTPAASLMCRPRWVAGSHRTESHTAPVRRTLSEEPRELPDDDHALAPAHSDSGILQNLMILHTGRLELQQNRWWLLGPILPSGAYLLYLLGYCHSPFSHLDFKRK